jgi:hypothetical protein
MSPFPLFISDGLVSIMEQINSVMDLSKEMTSSMKQCLTQFKQQEEVSLHFYYLLVIYTFFI